jgi:ribosomal protein L12E/L44/L45/RPP1/RPP2
MDEVQMQAESAKYAALRVVVDSLASASAEYISSALKRLLESDEIRAHVKEGIMPYLYAAGLLSFAAKEINEENLTTLIRIIGVEPNEYLIGVLLRTGIRSHLVYIYAFYYLSIGSRAVTAEKMEEVVEALGIQPDRDIAEEMRALNMHELG